MATTNPLLPIPLPIRGVLADKSLRLIGGEGLADAYNWIFRNGRFVNRDGMTRQTVDQFVMSGSPYVYERPMGITTFGTDIENSQVVIGTDKGWWVLGDNGTLIDITDRTDELTANLKTEQVIFRSLALSAATSTLVGVNGNDTAKYWDGNTSNDYVEILDGADTIVAKSLISIFNRMIYLNITYGGVDYPDGLMYTSYLTINGFDPIQLVRLADTPGYIVTGMEFGNMAAAIYKSDAIYVCSAIGQPNAPFRFDLKIANIAGPCSPLSVVPVSNGMHVFLASDGDVVLFDGSSTRSLGQHIQAHFSKYMDFENSNMSYGFYDYARKELYFMYVPYNATDVMHGVMINLNDPSFPTLWPMHYKTPMGAARVVMLNNTAVIGDLPGTIGGLEGAIGDFGAYEPTPVVGTDVPVTLTTGTASSGGDDTLVDTGIGWEVDEWLGKRVEITAGTGIGQSRYIGSNTTDTLSISPDWTINPDGTSVYKIITNESHLYTLKGVSDEDVPIEFYLRTGWYEMGEFTSWKTIQEIDHLFNISSGQEVDVQLSVSTSGENADLTDPQTIELTTPPFKTYHRSTGRLFCMVYSGECVDEIEWLGSEAGLKVRGRR